MKSPNASGDRAQVICGPSGSGKTNTALRRYAEQVAEHGEDTALLILPTARVVRHARARLIREQTAPGLVDPRIFTFPQLAQLILNANHECATAISKTAQSLLLREVIDGLGSAGELEELAGAGEMPGFVSVLGELITDLKRAAIEPRHFCRAMQRAGLAQAWHREIGGLYCAYQWLLICLRCFDQEGLFWWARGVLREGRRRPLGRVRLMVVDGFTDFTTTQLQMLQLLAEDIRETVVTLDHSPDDEREGLAPWFRDTLRRLEEHLGEVDVNWLPADDDDGPLAHLRAHLFEPEPPELIDAGQRVHIVKCPGHSREVREVLGRIKGVLARGEARPGEIAIICRSAAERAGTIRDVARRLGVPVHVEAPESPVTSPVISAVLHAYETVAEGYRREDVLALIRSTCLTFEPLSSREPTAEDVAEAAAKALVLEGREQWRTRLSAYRKRLQDARPEAAAGVGNVEEAIGEVFELLPDPGPGLSVRARVEEARAFIERTDVWRNVARADLAEDASVNLRALEQLDRALDELEHAREGGIRGASVSVRAFHGLLREALDNLADVLPSPAGDHVSVLDARQARQLRFRIAFVIGLTENEFPRRPREEPFFSATELRRLEGEGVLLERRRTPEAHEPLLFYGAIGAAERELWLTYACADVDGKQLQASHYLREVKRLFVDETIDEREIALSEVAADRSRVADARELADRALFDLTDQRDGESPAAYNALCALPGSRDVLSRIVSAVRLEDDRDSLQPTGAYVGTLTQPEIIADLAGTFGDDCRFSPTRLTDYAVCPFQFLCKYVLRLREPDYAGAAVDPREAGKVRHRILAVFTRRRIRRRPGGPLIAPGEEDEALEELDRIVTDEFSAALLGGAVAEESLWHLERERFRRDMELWVRNEVERFDEQAPIRCEFGFGRRDKEPVRLPGRSDILLRGRIDRVNLMAPGEPGAAYVLIDYKSGNPPEKKQIASGLDLQFPIYAIGAEAAIPETAGAACFGWHYWRITRRLKVVKFEKPEQIEEIRARLTPAIAEHVDGIRAGRFSYIDVDECASYCDVSDVCRHRTWRRPSGSEEADTSDSA